MEPKWDILKFTARLKNAGVDDGLADKVALEVSDIVHWERFRAIAGFKKRVLNMWETDHYDY